MSDELISLSDFLDWVDERASCYAAWASEVMADLGSNSTSLIDSCTDAIVWLKCRNIFLQVENRVNKLPRVSECLIERSVLLDMLSASVNTNKNRIYWGISRAAELGRLSCYVDMLKECQNVMRYENAHAVYKRMYSYARYMPTAGTIEARLQKGVIIHEKH